MRVVTMRAGNGHIHGNRRRWNVYVWIAMVFGFVILLGVIIKHKRTLNLLIQQKDAQLLSLHLLLQKEREHTQEIKAKSEGMRIKMYNLRARNSDLKSKISDLHSTISSLRDDRSTIELHLKEKQKEAELALTETTRRKEAEIEDLKHHLQLCANVESLSKQNDPSFVPANETANENIPGIERTINRNQEDEASKTDKEKNEYENDKTIDKEGNNASFTGIKEFTTVGNPDSGQISNSSQEIDSRELETQENSKDERFRFGGKSGYVKRAKGRRWKRAIEKRGKGDENGSDLKSQQFGIYGHKQLQENNGAKLENSTKTVDTEYRSVKAAVTKDVETTKDVEHMNSRERIKVSETSEDPETKTEKDEPAF